jgi:hypothetical protein
MGTETIIMQSIARRVDAGTYRPRHHAALVTLPAVGGRPMRTYVLELAACAAMGGIMGWMLGGGL